MSYAIRNDKQGLRAVDGPDDVGSDEYFSETPIEIVPMPLTFQKALSDLNAIYQSDVLALNQAYAMATLVDGPSVATKQAAIRAQYADRKAAHTANVAALKIEYGV